MEIDKSRPGRIDSDHDPVNLTTVDGDAIALYLSYLHSQHIDQQAQVLFDAVQDKHASAVKATKMSAELGQYKAKIDRGELPDVPQNVIGWMRQEGVKEHNQSGSLQNDVDGIRGLKAEKSDTEQKLQQYRSELEDLRRDLDSFKREHNTLTEAKGALEQDRHALIQKQGDLKENLEALNKKLKNNPDDPKLKQEIATTEKAIVSLEGEISAQREEISDKDEKTRSILEKLTGAAAALSDLEEKIASLTEKLASLEKEIQNSTRELSKNLNLNIESIKNLRDDIVGSIGEVIEKIRGLMDKRDEVSRLVATLAKESQIETERRESRKMEMKEQALEDEIKEDALDEDMRLYDEMTRKKKGDL